MVVTKKIINRGFDNERTEYYQWFTGKFHRKNGPALIYKDGTKMWYKNGYLHREDGPAIEWGGRN